VQRKTDEATAKESKENDEDIQKKTGKLEALKKELSEESKNEGPKA